MYQANIVRQSEQRITHYVRAVSGVNKDLVVGVGFSLHLLRAVGSWRLTFAAATTDKTRVTFKMDPFHKTWQRLTRAWHSLQPEIRVSPVGHGRGDVSVVKPGMPGKQDNASVAKHTVQKQLKRARQQVALG